MDETNRMDDTNELQSEGHPRWRALTLGTLSPDEEEALRRAAPDLHERCQPLDPALMVARVEASLAAKARLTAKARLAANAAGAKPSWWGPSVMPLAAALALAAAVVVVPVVSSLRGDPLRYAMTPPRGGAPVPPYLSTPDARLEAALSPVGRVHGPVAFRGALLLHPESGRARPLHLDLEPTRSNEFFISGTRGDLFPGVPSGDWDVLIAVGRPGPQLEEAEMRSLADQGPRDERQVLRLRVVLRGACVGTVEQPCPEGAP